MFFHIGKRRIVSLDTIVGIFNIETIEKSDINEYYQEEIQASSKSILVDCDDEVIVSEISSFTLIERDIINSDELLWKRGYYVRKL